MNKRIDLLLKEATRDNCVEILNSLINGAAVVNVNTEEYEGYIDTSIRKNTIDLIYAAGYLIGGIEYTHNKTVKIVEGITINKILDSGELAENGAKRLIQALLAGEVQIHEAGLIKICCGWFPQQYDTIKGVYGDYSLTDYLVTINSEFIEDPEGYNEFETWHNKMYDPIVEEDEI